MKKCPICNSDTESRSYSEEPFGTVEWYTVCKKCDYTDQESYGSHMVSFGKYLWVWGYNTQDIDKIEEEIDIALAKMKSKPSFTHRVYRYYSNSDSPF